MERLKRLIADTLVRNSLALMMATGVTSLLGFVFWAVAAHHYTTTIFGRTTALFAAANVIAIVGQLNVSSVLFRFLPIAAAKSRRFVAGSYAVTLSLSAVLAVIFLATGIGKKYLQGAAAFDLLFVVAVLVLLLGAVQDAVLISLRRSSVVLVENLVIALVRVAIVVVSADALPRTGIAFASILPSVISAPIIGVYLFRRALPRHERDSTGPSALPSRGRLLYFVGAASAKSIVSTGTTLVLPLIVAATLGLEATAYFSLPWLINTSFGLLTTNVSMSYIVEASFDGPGSKKTLRSALMIGGTVIVVGTVLEAGAAPLLLHIVGVNFASQGTSLMRLLGIALPLSAPTTIYAAFTWLDQRVWRLVVLEVIYSVILLGLSPYLLSHDGLSGVGWAYLLAEGAFGIGSIGPARRYLRGHASLETGPVAVAAIG